MKEFDQAESNRLEQEARNKVRRKTIEIRKTINSFSIYEFDDSIANVINKLQKLEEEHSEDGMELLMSVDWYYDDLDINIIKKGSRQETDKELEKRKRAAATRARNAYKKSCGEDGKRQEEKKKIEKEIKALQAKMRSLK